MNLFGGFISVPIALIAVVLVSQFLIILFP